MLQPLVLSAHIVGAFFAPCCFPGKEVQRISFGVRFPCAFVTSCFFIYVSACLCLCLCATACAYVHLFVCVVDMFACMRSMCVCARMHACVRACVRLRARL